MTCSWVLAVLLLAKVFGQYISQRSFKEGIVAHSEINLGYQNEDVEKRDVLVWEEEKKYSFNFKE